MSYSATLPAVACAGTAPTLSLLGSFVFICLSAPFFFLVVFRRSARVVFHVSHFNSLFSGVDMRLALQRVSFTDFQEHITLAHSLMRSGFDLDLGAFIFLLLLFAVAFAICTWRPLRWTPSTPPLMNWGYIDR